MWFKNLFNKKQSAAVHVDARPPTPRAPKLYQVVRVVQRTRIDYLIFDRATGRQLNIDLDYFDPTIHDLFVNATEFA